MNKIFTLFGLYFLMISFQGNVNAQMAVNGFFVGKGNTTLALSYTLESFDNFYIGEENTEPVPAHNEITKNVISIYGAYGILNNLEIAASIPYIFADGDGDPDPVTGITETNDFMDFMVQVKYAPIKFSLLKTDVQLGGALGYSVPITDYEPNGILSIGNGAPAFDVQGFAHVIAPSGWFGTYSIGYSFRGEADNLQGGPDFDVPDAFMFMGKFGYANSKFYIDFNYQIQQTDSDAIDIGGDGFNNNFPETRVNWFRLGVTGYYAITPLLGVSLSYIGYVDGRNVGRSQAVSPAVVVNF